MKLYGIAEIAEELGAKPDTVAQWYRRGKLPPPTARLKMGPVWTGRAIAPWLRRDRDRREKSDVVGLANWRLDSDGLFRSLRMCGSVAGHLCPSRLRGVTLITATGRSRFSRLSMVFRHSTTALLLSRATSAMRLCRTHKPRPCFGALQKH
jgi:hypothetical protein